MIEIINKIKPVKFQTNSEKLLVKKIEYIYKNMIKKYIDKSIPKDSAKRLTHLRYNPYVVELYEYIEVTKDIHISIYSNNVCIHFKIDNNSWGIVSFNKRGKLYKGTIMNKNGLSFIYEHMKQLSVMLI
jgi:hypothetical protein